MLELLTSNVSGSVRVETLDGREYLVAPLSMIVPGVLNGSKGPLLYPEDEVQKNPDDWNNMPIVNGHPLNKLGKAISARNPRVLEKYGMGAVYNASVNGKLVAEGWFDSIKTAHVNPRIYQKLKSGLPIELSTGLFTQNHKVKGPAKHNGKPYVAIARNYKPDHLAVLETSRGACSLEDGCGVNINQESEPSEDDLTPYMDWDGPVENQLSHDDLRSQLSSLLRQTYGSVDIDAVYDKSVIYCPSGYDSPGGRQYYEVGYSTDLRTGKVSLSDQGTKKVIRETKYKSVGNEECDSCGPTCDCKKCKDEHAEKKPAPTSNTKKKAVKKSTNNSKETLKMAQKVALTDDQKEALIDNLIVNCEEADGPWTEEDREVLNAFSDDKLQVLDRQQKLLLANAEADDEEDEEDEDEPAPKKKGKVPPQFAKNKKKTKMSCNEEVEDEEAPVINQKAKSKTTQEWLDDAPDEIRSAVSNALAFERNQKQTLIARIVKNERNQFGKEYLKKRSLEELQGLAALAVNAGSEEDRSSSSVLVPHYAGVASPIMNLGEDFAHEDQDMIPEPFDWSTPEE